MFVPGKLFQPSLIFAVIRLGWKSYLGTNALAYYKNSHLAAVKSFITLATERFLEAALEVYFLKRKSLRMKTQEKKRSKSLLLNKKLLANKMKHASLQRRKRI